jgi:CheY-like chemotaxis protein
MNGSISVESEYGKGSIFTVSIEQIIVESKPVGREVAATLENLTFLNRHLLHASFKRQEMPDVKVLVVDDMPSNLEVARGFLALYGMKVDCAGSGEEAIKILKEKADQYDLVFLDHMMPVIDGYEVLQTLRKDIGGFYAGSIPVIALSANAMIGSRETFIKMGFQDFLSKPINALQLDEVLKKWIPEQKIGASSAGEKAAVVSVAAPPADGKNFDLAIEGIDTIVGFKNAEFDEESYYYMLNSFCRDSLNKMSLIHHAIYNKMNVEKIENIDEETVIFIKTVLRTMKALSFSIGAHALAEEAALLETSLMSALQSAFSSGMKAVDDEVFKSSLPAFLENTQIIVDRISNGRLSFVEANGKSRR